MPQNSRTKFDAMKADPNLKDKLKDVTFPDLNSKTTIDISMTDGGSLPDDLVELLRTADVTNITERTVTVAERMFAEQTPSVIADITDGVNTGLASLATARADVDKAHAKLVKAVTGLDKAITGMTKGINGMKSGIAGMTKAITGMDSGLAGTAKAIEGMDKGIAKIDKDIAGLKAALAGVQAPTTRSWGRCHRARPSRPPRRHCTPRSTASRPPSPARSREGLPWSRSRRSSRADRAKLAAQRATLAAKRRKLSSASSPPSRASEPTRHRPRKKLVKARDEIGDRVRRPGRHQQEADHPARRRARRPSRRPRRTTSPRSAAIGDAGDDLRDTLNGGFRNIYLSTIAAGLLAALLLALYPRRAAAEKESTAPPDRAREGLVCRQPALAVSRNQPDGPSEAFIRGTYWSK